MYVSVRLNRAPNLFDRNKHVTADESSVRIDRSHAWADDSAAEILVFIFLRFFGEPKMKGWSTLILLRVHPTGRVFFMGMRASPFRPLFNISLC